MISASLRNVARGRLGSLFVIAVTLLAGVSAAWHADAATYTWNGGGGTLGPIDGSGTWNTANANWWSTSTIAWSDNNDAVFGANSGTAGIVSIATTVAPSSITFAPTLNGTYTISGGSINLNNGGGGSMAVTTNINAAIASQFVGTNGLTKAGTGTLTLSANSTYGGPTVISNGTLRFSAAAPVVATSFVGNASPASGTLPTPPVSLIAGLTPVVANGDAGQEGTGGVANLTDGVNPLMNGTTSPYSQLYTVGNSTSLTYTLPTGGLGYNISGVNIFADWKDNGRSQISISNISYSTVANPTTFVPISNTTVSNYQGSAEMNEVSYSATGGLMANNVYAIQINCGSTTNGYVGYGELQVFGSGSNLLPIATPLSVGAGAMLDLGGNPQQVASLADYAGGVGSIINSNTSVASILSLATSGSSTFSGMIQGGGTLGAISLVMNGAGTQVLAGSNTYTGATTITAGTLQIGSGGSGEGLASPSIINNSALVFNHADALTYTGVISGSGNVTKAGAGTTTLTAASTVSGPVTISGGTLQFGTGTTGNDGSIAASGIVNNSALAFNVAANQAYSGVISGSGAVTKSGAGLLILSGTNSYSGATNISGGTLQLAPRTPIAAVTAGSQLYLNAASITGISNGGTVTAVTDLSGSGNNTTAGGGTVTYQANGLNGAPTLVFNGASYLNDALSSSGNTGTIFVVMKSANLTQGAGAFVGASANSGLEFRQTTNNLQLLREGVTDLVNTTSNALTTSGQIVAVTFNQSSGGSEQFYINGAVQAITGTNTTAFAAGLTTYIGGAANGEDFNGDISAIVSYNTVLTPAQIAATTTALNNQFFVGGGAGYSALPSTTPVNISAAGATLDLFNSNQTIGSLTGVAGSFVRLGGAALTVGTNNTTTTFAGNITDSGGASTGTGGSLTKTGTGTLTLAGANTYTGATNLNNGVLNAGSPEVPGVSGPFGAQLPSAANTISFGGGTLQYSVSNQYDYSSRFSTASSQSYSVDTNGQNVTWNTALTSAGGALTKIGAGTLTLGASSAYTGATTILGGTLKLAPAVSVTLASSTASFTTDAGSGIGSASPYGSAGYTQALAFNGTNGMTINGLAFTAGSQSGPNYTTANWFNNYNNATFSGAGTQTNPLFYNFIYGPGNTTQTLTLTGLTPGLAYDARVYYRNWDSVGNIRAATWTVNTGAAALTTPLINEDANTTGNYLDFTYVAGPTGTLTLTASDYQNTNSWHLYGFTNQLIGSTNTGNLPATTPVSIAQGATLDLDGLNQQVGSLANVSGAAGTIINSSASSLAVLSVAPTATFTFGGSLQNGSGTLGLTINGPGTQVLAGSNSYTGPTLVNTGTLTLAGTGSLASPAITVASGARFALADTASVAGPAITIASGGLFDVSALSSTFSLNAGQTLTIGRTSTPASDLLGSMSLGSGTINIGGTGTVATATFGNNLSLSGGAMIFDLSNSANAGNDTVNVAGNLNLTNTTTIYINKLNPSLASGFYPLFSYSGSLSGSPSGEFTLAGNPLTSRQTASFTTSGSTVYLDVVGSAQTLTWAGSAGSVWNNSAGNFVWTNLQSNPDYFVTADNVIFNNSNTNTAVNVGDVVSPGSALVSGSQNYTFSGTGSIVGPTTTLTMNGTGILTIATTGNTFGGGTMLNSGTIAQGVANAMPATGPLFIASGATFDLAGFNGQAGPLSGSGTVTTSGTSGTNIFTTTTANSSTFAGSLQDGASAALALHVAGTGSLVLTGANNYSGATVINGGTLNFASGGNTTLSGNISGSGSLLQFGAGTLILTGSNGYGGTAIAAASTLEIGNGGATGTLGAGAVADNGALVFNRGNGIAVSNVISGSGLLTQSGSGTLTLSGSNTYTGATTLSAGSLNLASAESANVSGPLGKSPAANPGSIVLNGGFLQYSSANQNDYSGRFSTAPGQQYNVDTNGQNVTWATPLISSGGSLDKAGNGTLTLPTVSTYGGATSINGGTLAIVGGGQLGSGAYAGNLSLTATGSTFLYSSSAAQTLSGVIGGSGSLIAQGAGTLTLGNTNTYSGGTTLTAGEVSISSISNIGSGPLTFNGGTLQVTGSALANLNAATINASSFNGGFDIPGGNAFTVNQNLSGNGSLSKLGSGTLILNGSNSYTGSTTISAGIAQLANQAGIPDNTPLNLAGGTLDLNGFSKTLNSATGLTAGAVTNSNQVSASILNLSPTAPGAGSNQITVGTLFADDGSGTLGLLVTSNSGSGILLSNSSNAYSGGTNINNSFVRIGNNTAAGTGTITVSNSGFVELWWQTGSGTISNNFMLNTPGGHQVAGSQTGAKAAIYADGGAGGYGAYTLSGSITLGSNGGGVSGDGANNLNIAGPISGPGSLQIGAPAGTFPIDGGDVVTLINTANSYQGGTNINSGTLAIYGDGALGSGTGGVTFVGNTTLQAAANNIELNAARSIAISAATATIDTQSNNMQIDGAISGSGGLTKIGAGTLTLTNANTYSGPTAINVGTLAVANSQAVQNSTVTLSGGNLSFVAPATAATLGGLAGATNVSLQNSLSQPVALTVGNNNSSTSYSGVLSGGNGLTKVGSGTFTIQASQSYSGPTIISGGTVKLLSAIPTGTATGSYTTVASYTFTPAANNLLLHLTPTVVGNANAGSEGNDGVGGTGDVPTGAATVLTDGTISTTGNVYANLASVYTVGNGSQISFTLGNSPNGYDLSTINIYSLWNDNGRGQINLSDVSYSTVANPTVFTAIPSSAVTSAASADNYEASLAASGGVLASRVYAVRFDFATPQENNWAGYAELEAVGAPTPLGNNILPASTALTIAAGSTLDLSGGSQQVASLGDFSPGAGGSIINSWTGATSLLTLATSGSSTFSGTIQGGGTLGAISMLMNGSGTQILAGTNTYTGATTISGGTLQLGTGVSGQDGSIANTSGVTDNSAFVYDLYAARSVAYAIGGSGSVAQLGANKLTLNGSDTYSGGTYVGGGTLQIGVPGALGTGGLTANAGVLDLGGNGQTVTFLRGAAGTITNGGGSPATLTVNQSTTTTFGGSIVDGAASIALAMTGNGALSLGNTNGYSGGTSIVNGTLRVGVNNALPASTTVTFGGNGTAGILDLAGNNQTVGGLAVAASAVSSTQIIGNSSTSHGSVLTFAGTGSSTFGGTIQDGVNGGISTTGLTVSGGNLALTGANNTYSGPTTVSGGLLTAAAFDTLSPNSAISVVGGTLDASSFGQSIASLTMGSAGAVNVSIGNLLNSSGTDSFAGTIDVLGFSGGTQELMTYGSHSGAFASVVGLTGAYQLAYSMNQLDIVASGPPTWQFATSGSWNDGSKWSDASAPSGVGQTAVLGAATSVPWTITLDSPQTLGSLTFTNTASSAAGYTLATGVSGSLTLDNSGSAVQVVVNGGSHAITAPVYLVGGDLQVSASNDSVLTIGGNIGQDATRNLTLNGDGTGELILSGTNTLGGPGAVALVSSGTLVLNDPQALADGTSLTVGDASAFGGIQPAGGAETQSAVGGPIAAVSIAPVPEPGTLAIVAAIIACGALFRRSRRKQAPPRRD